MSDFGHIIADDTKRQALVNRRVDALLKLYMNGRLSAANKAELRSYLGGRLPHESESLQVENPSPAPIMPEEEPQNKPREIAEPSPDKDRAAWLLRRWAHRVAADADVRALHALFPPSPQLVGHLTRATYQRPLIDYARDLGYRADATLKRWLDDGRAADPPDLPPFDQPEQLAAWWARVKRRKVPPELLTLAANQPSAESSQPPVESAPKHDAAPPLPQGTGFSASLERAEQNERQAAHALDLARKSGEPGAIRMAQESWTRAFKELRQASKDAAEILLANGEMVRWPEVEADMAAKLQVINQALRSLMTRIATKVTIPPDLLPRISKAFQEELDRVFEDLDKSDFQPPFGLAA